MGIHSFRKSRHITIKTITNKLATKLRSHQEKQKNEPRRYKEREEKQSKTG